MSRIYAKSRCPKFLCRLKRLPETTSKTLFHLRKKVEQSEHYDHFAELENDPMANKLNTVMGAGLCRVSQPHIFREWGYNPKKGQTQDPEAITQICAMHGMERYEIDLLCKNGGIVWG